MDALVVAIESRKVLDADIRSFFDTVDREWLIRFVEHRVGDRRITTGRRWVSELGGHTSEGILQEHQNAVVDYGGSSSLFASIRTVLCLSAPFPAARSTMLSLNLFLLVGIKGLALSKGDPYCFKSLN
jgi:hypothetical protein